MRLEPIVYWVDTSTASDPALSRTEGGALSAPCVLPNCSVLAQQVIGFKVGAMLWDKTISTDGQTGYDYNATSTGYNNSFWEIRSIQLSLDRTNHARHRSHLCLSKWIRQRALSD